MNKKEIVSKTVLFIAIVVFIGIFRSVFGGENTLVGVTTITAILMFLQTDLTISPVKNTFKLVTLNVLMGIAAYVASSNMWLAIPINFVTVFILGYTFCYSLKKPMYTAFMLQYLFILTAPVGPDKILVRLAGLAVGALLIMGVQLLANKNKISKSGNKVLADVASKMLNKIDLIKENKNDEELNINIGQLIQDLRKMVYDKRKQQFYLTEEGRIKLNLSVALEKTNFILDKIEYNDNNKDIFNSLYELLTLTKNELENNKDKDGFEKQLQQLLKIYEKEEDLLILQTLGSIKFISETLTELKVLDDTNKNLINKIEEIPAGLRKLSIHKKNLTTTSIKFTYAIKIAFAITLGAFIMDYGNAMGYSIFSEGRWILFTLLSLITPLYEVSRKKLKERFVGTLIGAVIIVILYGIFTDVMSRTIILLVTGYIANYLSQYKYMMITTTISAIGAAALMGDAQVLTVERIIFVAFGVILAAVINNLILRYRISDANESLKEMYSDAVNEMIISVYYMIKGENRNNIKNCILITSLIEERLAANNEVVNNDYEDEKLEEKRLLVSNIYELYISVKENKIKENDAVYILKDSQELIKYKLSSVDKVSKRIKEHICIMEDINDKIILSNSLEVIQGLAVLNK